MFLSSDFLSFRAPEAVMLQKTGHRILTIL